jgi:putative PIN family toxin of toxin-antitoxin system
MPSEPSGGPNVRAVLDTNLVVSGFLYSGTPKRLIDLARAGTFEPVTSPVLLGELRGVLGRPKFAHRFRLIGLKPDEVVADYAALARVVQPAPLPVPVSADPDDDAVLACAVAVAADAVASGDQHLLALGSYQGIPILTAAELLARLTPPAASSSPPTP